MGWISDARTKQLGRSSGHSSACVGRILKVVNDQIVGGVGASSQGCDHEVVRKLAKVFEWQLRTFEAQQLSP